MNPSANAQVCKKLPITSRMRMYGTSINDNVSAYFFSLAPSSSIGC